MKFSDEINCEGIWVNDKSLCKETINCCNLNRNGYEFLG